MKKEMHGMSHVGGNQHPLYRTWAGMKERCSNPNHMMYHRYGGRGISVEERWLTFTNFIADVGEKPDPTYTLDRVDNNGNYGPDNFRWATRKEQSMKRETKGGRPKGSKNKEAAHVV